MFRYNRFVNEKKFVTQGLKYMYSRTKNIDKKKGLYKLKVTLNQGNDILTSVFFNLGSAEPRGSVYSSLDSVRILKLALF